jgi:aminopeptidase N
MGKKVTRLFEQFQPEHYDLALDIDRDAMKFSGTVTIRGKKTGRPSERLTFHQKDLKVTKAAALKHDKSGDQPVNIARINNQNSFDEVRLHADGMVYPGSYTVTLEFEGEITRPMNGIYPCREPPRPRGLPLH